MMAKTSKKYSITENFKNKLSDIYKKFEDDTQLDIQKKDLGDKTIRELFVTELEKNESKFDHSDFEDLKRCISTINRNHFKGKGELHSAVSDKTLIGRVMTKENFTDYFSVGSGMYTGKSDQINNFFTLHKYSTLRKRELERLKKQYFKVNLGRYFCWGYLNEGDDNSVINSINIADLPCRLGLPTLKSLKGRKIEWVVSGHFPIGIECRIPTILDASINDDGTTYFVPGGHTKSHKDCEKLEGLPEVFHKPNIFGHNNNELESFIA